MGGMAMAQATQDPVIVAAQERLMQKRATLSQTEHHGQRIANTDFNAIANRCLKKATETANVFPWKEQEEKATEVKPKTKTTGWIDGGTPKAYRECTFENYHGNDKLIKDLQRFIGASWDGIVLRGNTGCGKTHLAIAIARQIPTEPIKMRGGWDVAPGSVFTTAPELLLKIRSAFRDDAKQSEEQLIEYYSGCELLILDDLGSEKTSEFAITTLYIILDRRIRENLKTIITTNLLQSEIEATFGARIASRMSAMENIKINMPDYRKKRG
jgi:DNA replication protein DnaC